uniref:chitinase n=1 Tax=Phallusia mammillata TaxID=59560 RepID=A0A6F9D6G3_9ASCI|nr:L-rhamnose-binding lectin SML [Phallusia mammillata]
MLKQVIVIVAAFALVAQAVEITETCTGDDGEMLSTGPMANPDDCSKFYQCSNGYLYNMDCPSGLVFNPENGACDYLENVPSCQPTEPPTPPPPPPPTPPPVVESTVICENDKKKISCPLFYSLFITDAFYGRDDATTCGGPVKTTDCKAAMSLIKIRDQCNSENFCFLYADNSEFGDPCVGTFKYIRMSYKCRLGGDLVE